VAEQVLDRDLAAAWIVGEEARDRIGERELALAREQQHRGRGERLRQRGDVEARRARVRDTARDVREAVGLAQQDLVPARDEHDARELARIDVGAHELVERATEVVARSGCGPRRRARSHGREFVLDRVAQRAFGDGESPPLRALRLGLVAGPPRDPREQAQRARLLRAAQRVRATRHAQGELERLRVVAGLGPARGDRAEVARVVPQRAGEQLLGQREREVALTLLPERLELGQLRPRREQRSVLRGGGLAIERAVEARAHHGVDLERRRDGRDAALAVQHERDRDRAHLGRAHPGLDRAPAEDALVALLGIALRVQRDRVADGVALALEQRVDGRLVVPPFVGTRRDADHVEPARAELALERCQVRHVGEARSAPGGPELDHVNAARLEPLARRAAQEALDHERRRGIADEERRRLLRSLQCRREKQQEVRHEHGAPDANPPMHRGLEPGLRRNVAVATAARVPHARGPRRAASAAPSQRRET